MFIYNNLSIRLNIKYIGELIQKHREDLFGLGFKDVSVGIVETALAQRGLHLGKKLTQKWISPEE